jgi:hypothetical protein
MKQPTPNESLPQRRRVIRGALSAAIIALFGNKSASAQADLSGDGVPLTAHLRRGNPPSQPLDTLVLFERGDENNKQTGTHEVLSLVHEERGKRSYPWTLYTSLDTHHEEGDACGHCARLHKHGPGWSAGLHSEVFSHGRAVALGVNIEMQCDYVGPEPTNVIGLNIQPTGGTRTMQYAVQIQDGKGRFETGIGLNGKGQTAIDLRGDYTVGLHTHANSIRLNEGACIELEESGKIRLRYRAGRIEFLNGEKCFGHLDVNGEDHHL